MVAESDSASSESSFLKEEKKSEVEIRASYSEYFYDATSFTFTKLDIEWLKNHTKDLFTCLIYNYI